MFGLAHGVCRFVLYFGLGASLGQTIDANLTRLIDAPGCVVELTRLGLIDQSDGITL